MMTTGEAGMDRLLTMLDTAHARHIEVVERIVKLEAELASAKEVDRVGLEDLRRELRRELELAKEAVKVAHEAIMQHLAVLNEFGKSFRDMKAEYPSKAEVDSEMTAINVRLNSEFAAQNSRLSALERDSDRAKGALESQKATQTKFFLVFGTLITLVTVAVNVVSKLLTAQ